MAHPIPQTLDAILDEAKAAIIHVADVAPLMKSKFALADGDLDAMDAVEDRPDGERRQVARPGRAA